MKKFNRVNSFFDLAKNPNFIKKPYLLTREGENRKEKFNI